MLQQPKQSYLIMLAGDSRFCLGAQALAAAAPLALKPHDDHDTTLRWQFDGRGLIRAAADPGLCIEVRDVSGGTGLACLGKVMPGKLAQHWRRGDAAIVSELYPKLVLAIAEGTVVDGSPVRVRALSGAAAGQWQLRAVMLDDGA